jgi:acetyl esterase/lipase
MSRAQRDAIVARLRARTPSADPEARRAGFEAFAAAIPAPPDLDVEEVRLEGAGRSVPARRVTAPGADRRTAILYLHGGAFVVGSSRSYTGHAGRLSGASGATVVVPDYRLAPEFAFPAALEDSLTAFSALENEGYGPRSVALAGDSAGANLALATCLARKRRALPPAAAVWCLSPYLDLTHSGESIVTRRARDPFVDPATMPATAAAYLGDTDPEDPLASPLFGDPAGLPPLYLQVGADEVLYDDARRMAERAAGAGVDVRFEEWPDMIHVWAFFGPWLDEADQAIRAAGHFLRTYLKQGAP